MTFETISAGDMREPQTNVKTQVLRTYSRLLRTVLDEVSDAVLVLDPFGDAIMSNRAFARLLGPRPGSGVGQRDLGELLGLLGADADAGTLAELLSAQDVPRMSLNLQDGGTLDCEVKLLSLEQPGDHRLITFREGSPLGHELRELRHRAFHDRLTGLPNRELLLDRLHQAIARSAREGAAVGVVFVDLDGFKEVNDELGHAAGDEVLVEVSARLASGMRQVDTVGRLGGDEFVIVCEALTDVHSVEVICQRVQVSLADPFAVEGRSFSVTASMGAVLEWDRDVSPSELIARADTQMYAAKRDGSQVSIETGHSSSIDERAARLARTLGRALEGGQLELLYLPVMALGQDRVVAVEALLRCSHPDLGEFTPLELVEMADQGGFLNQLSTWILREGAGVVASMRDDSGDDLSVLINLSAEQLADPGLGEVISLAASAAGIERRLLGFDIAEPAIVANQPQLERRLRTLSDLGCQLYADDVTGGGVGVESLSRLGFSGIKLDRVLMEAAAHVDGSLDTGTALVHSAHEFDMSVVAEGVSDEHTLLTARRLGCDGAQGYALYGVPRRLTEIKRLID
jgi:diguanylate cyclase (GGDEF)-like protein